MSSLLFGKPPERLGTYYRGWCYGVQTVVCNGERQRLRPTGAGWGTPVGSLYENVGYCTHTSNFGDGSGASTDE